MNLSDRFEQILREKKLIFPGERIFIACSGGPDSVILLHLLKALQKKWNLRLGLLHFNHKLRGSESDHDEQFVKNLAKKFSLSFYSGRKQFQKKAKRDNESPEEAARKARYEFFLKMGKRHRISKIALAHTQNDQAETVLMRVLQGTGLRGLAGIREQMKVGPVTFVRPLLEFSKKELLDYLKKNRIAFRRDKSNRSERFLRNRIRIKLLPWLEREFNPRLVQALARIPAIVKEENELLEELEKTAWNRTLKRRLNGRLYLDRSAFLKFPSSLQFRILQRALQKLDIKSGIDFEAWQKLKPNLSRHSFRYSLPRDIDLSLTPSQMMVYKKFSRV